MTDPKKPSEEIENVEFDPDDEALEQTPPDVVAVLGFDPAETEEIETPNDQ